MSLTREQYDAIMREYDFIRSKNEELTEKKRAKIYREHPELMAWENRVVTLKVHQSRMKLEGNASVVEDIDDEIMMLMVKRTSLLESAGLTEEDFETICDCKECKDTGYVRGSDNVTRKCQCFRKRELEILYDQSGIRQLLNEENFSKLSLDYRQGEDLERLKKAVGFCRDFVANFDQDYRNIVFCGTVGTGKSYLSSCIAYELLKSYHSVIYLSSQQLFEKLADKQFGDRDSRDDSVDGLSECDLLIIDDLGTELTNSFVASALFGLLNSRHLNRKSTVISTNLDLTEIRDRYSDRILSRLTGSYSFINLTGQDMRKLMRN